MRAGPTARPSKAAARRTKEVPTALPFVHDGSSRAPRLEVHQALWGMIGLPGGGLPDWPLEEQLARIAEAGFTGVLGSVPPPAERPRWRDLLDRHGLAFGAMAFPSRPEDLEPVLEASREFGAAYVNAQVMDGFVVGQGAVDLLGGLVERSERAGVPFFAETHRGRVTQDLLRTVDYVRALPRLLLTIDFSHYVVGGEIGSPTPAAEQAFGELLARTGSIHARVSNGEQVQVDVGEGSRGPVTHFRRWWTEGMRRWRAAARPGDILPFVAELGPPGYAITTPEGREVGDRWAQALVLRRVALECWAEAGGV